MSIQWVFFIGFACGFACGFAVVAAQSIIQKNKHERPAPPPTVDQLLDYAVARISEREWGEPSSPIMYKRGIVSVGLSVKITNPDNPQQWLGGSGLAPTISEAIREMLLKGFEDRS